MTVPRKPLPVVTCIEDVADKRIKIQFADLPDPETRKLVYDAGFRFRGGPAQYWVRRLDAAGRRAAALVMAQLQERTEEDNQ